MVRGVEPLSRRTLEIPPSLATTRIGVPHISPDGRHVVIVGQERRLYLRRMDALEFEPMPGTDGASSAFWSPDSRSIAFTVGSQLKVVKLARRACALHT